MTKRYCFVTQVGDAIEKLADALDPERSKPFKGDILDLLEWAARDVLEMRQQLAEALLACKVKDEIIEKFRRAIGDHCAPNDCYATGPLTGNNLLDLVQCPACSALAAYEEALDAAAGKAQFRGPYVAKEQGK